MLFNQTLNPSSHKNADLLRMISHSFVHIANTERKIKRKDQASCYKKYRVHRCSINIGITNCATATVTQNFTRLFSGSLRIIPEMEHELFPTGYF